MALSAGEYLVETLVTVVSDGRAAKTTFCHYFLLYFDLFTTLLLSPKPCSQALHVCRLHVVQNSLLHEFGNASDECARPRNKASCYIYPGI